MGSIRLKYMATKKQAMKLQVYSCPLSGSAGDLSNPAALPEGFTLYGEDECELKDVMTAPGFTIFDPLSLNDQPVKGMVMVSCLAGTHEHICFALLLGFQFLSLFVCFCAADWCFGGFRGDQGRSGQPPSRLHGAGYSS
jgi:hypothetical protein